MPPKIPPLHRQRSCPCIFFGGPFANPALRRVGLGHLAGGDSPRGSPWNGCGRAAETLNGVVNHALRKYIAMLPLRFIRPLLVVIRDSCRRKGDFGLSFRRRKCPGCGAALPVFRRPLNERQRLYGGTTCKSCGLESDKWGQPVNEAT
jgi:hypothetical protein